jgi:hypothetical protein
MMLDRDAGRQTEYWQIRPRSGMLMAIIRRPPKRTIAVMILLALAASLTVAAVEFLGVQLCDGSVPTSVVLPVESPLTLESTEIGRHGGLLMLLRASNGNILDHIDDLMQPYVGAKGSGDEKKLQWSGNSITAYAQVIKKGYAALAVSTDYDADAVADWKLQFAGGH